MYLYSGYLKIFRLKHTTGYGYLLMGMHVFEPSSIVYLYFWIKYTLMINGKAGGIMEIILRYAFVF